MAHNCLKYMIVLPKLTFEGLKRPLRCKLSMKHIGLQGPRGHGVGLEGHRGSRGRPTGSQGVKVKAYIVPVGQGVGLQGPK